MLTREMVEARLVQLRADFDRKRLELAALDGAVQDAEWFLSQLTVEDAPQSLFPQEGADGGER